MSQRSVPLATTAFGWSQAQNHARAFSPHSDPLQMMRGAVLAADVAVVLAMSLMAHLFRHGDIAMPVEGALSTLLAAVLLFNILKLAGCYGRLLQSTASVQITRALQGWCLVFTALLVFAYLTKTSEQFSRLWVTTWFVCTTAGLAGVRVWAAGRLRIWRRTGRLARTIAVVDLDGRGAALTRGLLAGSAGEIHLLGVFSAAEESPQQNRVEDLLGLARLFRVDDVVIAASEGQDREVEGALLKLGSIPANIRLSLRMPALSVPARDASILFGQPVVSLCNRPLGDWSKVAKRLEDVAISLVAIVALSPLMAIVAASIKLDSPGPVLFRQPRLGFNNNVIVVFKFRSMTHRPAEPDDVTQARRFDPRVTRVGRFLRRSSLDELPQLFNVLRGTMSLVGPRPHALAHNEYYAALIDGYLRRHNVQPGITGWAQVNGLRGETDTLAKMQRRVEFDLAYTDDWSLALDAKILFMTFSATLFHRNAY